MIQPWIVSAFFDCENVGLRAWAGSGWANLSSSTLHCPNASSVAAFRAALQRGDLFMHAFPHDGEASYYPDAGLFNAALDMATDLSQELGIPPPRSVSQRDVPGWSRATLSHLVRRNITGLSIGAGTPPGKPDTPPVFLWRDEQSNSTVMTTYETGYGNVNEVFVLKNGIALVAAWDSVSGESLQGARVGDVWSEI